MVNFINLSSFLLKTRKSNGIVHFTKLPDKFGKSDA